VSTIYPFIILLFNRTGSPPYSSFRIATCKLRVGGTAPNVKEMIGLTAFIHSFIKNALNPCHVSDKPKN
jgi:hypothetical protein